MSAKARLLEAAADKRSTTIALVGMGGNGKTAVAEEISSDPKVREAFPGGVLWLGFGLDASFTIARAVSEGLARAGVSTKDLDLSSDQMALQTLREGLDGESVLVVHDDIWRAQQLPELPVQCTRLITTRVDQIAGEDKAPIPVGRLPETAAHRLLAHKIRFEDEHSAQRLGQLASSLRGWTSLLRLVNDELRAAQNNGQPLTKTLDDFEAFVGAQDISALDQTHGGQDAQELRRIAVRFCLDYGFDALSENERRVFYNLGIIPQGVEMPVEAACDFARHAAGVSGPRAKTLFKQFSGRSIFREFDWKAATFRVHDELWAYFRASVQQGGRWVGLHRAMLSALREHCTDEWSTLKQDHEYGWAQLLYHLSEGDNEAQVDELLTDYDWLKAKLEALEARELYRSFNPDTKNTDIKKIGRTIALSLPVIAKRKEAFALQIYGRLGHEASDPLKGVAEQARHDTNFFPVPLRPHLSPLGAERMRFEGHTGDLTSAVLSCGGTRMLTASWDQTARLWDVETGRVIISFDGHRGLVMCAVFSLDCTRVLTSSTDGTARLWNAETGMEMLPFEGHRDAVTNAVFAPDGTRVLTASRDHTARLWDVETGEGIWSFEGHSKPVLSAAFSCDGTRVLTASDDHTARLWNAETGTEMRPFVRHNNGVTSAVFSRDGTRVVTASWDCTARLWDAETGTEVLPFEGHRGWLASAVFSPDDTRVLTSSSDCTARVWDAETGAEILRLEGHGGSVVNAAYSHDGMRVVTASNDCTARIWDSETGRELQSLEGHDNSVVSANFSPDGTRLLTASTDRTARLWDVEEEQRLTSAHDNDRRTTSAALSADGRRLLTASDSWMARLWNVETGEQVRTFHGRGRLVTSATLSLDGSRVLTAFDNGEAILWDSGSGEEIKPYSRCYSHLIHNAISAIRSFTRFSSTKNPSLIWYIDRRFPYPLQGSGRKLTSSIFSVDGQYILTASLDCTAKLWNAKTGAQAQVFEGHTEPLTHATLSPAGDKVLTTSVDDTARLWDIKNGTQLQSFKGHDHIVTSGAFSRDGSHVVTASRDHTAKLWDALSGRPIRSFEGHESAVTGVVFLSDGRRFLTSSEDRTARLWDMETGEPLAVMDFDFALYTISISKKIAVVAGKKGQWETFSL
ncbi:MAG: NB-ARC domain-containing protein [Pseudomonadota bacterium]